MKYYINYIFLWNETSCTNQITEIDLINSFVFYFMKEDSEVPVHLHYLYRILLVVQLIQVQHLQT